MTTKKTTRRTAKSPATDTPEETTTPKAPEAETVTIRGLIATTTLRRGDTTTVTRTDHVDGLIAGGYVEIVE